MGELIRRRDFQEVAVELFEGRRHLAVWPRREGVRTRYGAAVPVVEALLQSAQRQRAGAKAGVTDTVAALTGRPEGTFGGWARDHLAAFAPGG